ncbi:MAG: hypothetical protein ACRENG_32020 [bacterium]
MSTSVEAIDIMIAKLEPQEQLAVAERVIKRLREAKPKKARHWHELEGLGKEIWQDVDVNQYIRELR